LHYNSIQCLCDAVPRHAIPCNTVAPPSKPSPLQHFAVQFRSLPLLSLTPFSFAFALLDDAYLCLRSAEQCYTTAKRLIAIHNHCRAKHRAAFAEHCFPMPLLCRTMRRATSPLLYAAALCLCDAALNRALLLRCRAIHNRCRAIHNRFHAIQYFAYAAQNTTMLCLCPAKQSLSFAAINLTSQCYAYAFICSLPSYIFATLRHIGQPFLFASDINIPIADRFNASA